MANQECLFPAVFHYFREPLVLTKAKDQYVWDADGNQYLDFFGGILTVSVGHCNEKVNRAVHAQVDKLQHVSTVFPTEPQAALARKISTIAPGSGWKSFFTSSGTEANEMAILAARCFTGSSDIIALRHSYHGRSSLAMGVTGQAAWKVGPPVQTGITFAHNAYCYRCPFGLKYPDCELRCAQDVGELIRTTTTGQIAGMIAEPIQGVGGFITPPKEYFVSNIVREYGGVSSATKCRPAGAVLAIAAGIDQWGVTPDIVTSAAFGQRISSAPPPRPEVADSVRNSPSPRSAAAPALPRPRGHYRPHRRRTRRAMLLPSALTCGASRICKEVPLIGDVRGMGLAAIELVRSCVQSACHSRDPAPWKLREPPLDRARRIERNVIRISPPLNISAGDVDTFIRTLDASLAEVSAPVLSGH
jgi:4-aminobutyrate aminotransferase-like enzyme